MLYTKNEGGGSRLGKAQISFFFLWCHTYFSSRIILSLLLLELKPKYIRWSCLFPQRNPKVEGKVNEEAISGVENGRKWNKETRNVVWCNVMKNRALTSDMKGRDGHIYEWRSLLFLSYGIFLKYPNLTDGPKRIKIMLIIRWKEIKKANKKKTIIVAVLGFDFSYLNISTYRINLIST